MDADCVLNANIHFLYTYNTVFVTNNRNLKNIFNGFIMVEKGNPILKEMISYMLRIGTSIDNYYYNCIELYNLINKYIHIQHNIHDYRCSIGNICLLIDKIHYNRYSAYYKNINILTETNELYPYK
jgi:hypothetical protein